MTRAFGLGDAGGEVRDIQQRLTRLLGPQLGPDGVFGAETLEAVRSFQRDRGLAADGVVGPETWRSLVEAGFSLGDRLLWHAANMMRGDDVHDLQHRLNQLGFDAGAEDGIFGRLAASAVEEFQRNVGLDVDGIAGPAMLEALRRLHRAHHAGGVAVRVREQEWMRGLSARGLVGARILLDPAQGPADPGRVGPSGLEEAEVGWAIANRVAARLAARGAQALLTRGPALTPTPSERARLANEQGVDACISIGVSAHSSHAAAGPSAYYFGAPHFSSEGGRRLAESVQAAALTSGWAPDGRVHPRAWAILRETRMPTVRLEPGFITSPQDEDRLGDPTCQERLAAALADAVAEFLERAGGDA